MGGAGGRGLIVQGGAMVGDFLQSPNIKHPKFL